jgi:hypothetical protein
VSVDDAPGRWQAYYRKWPTVTREHLDPDLLDLVPALRRYAPPAQVFDKGVYSAFAAPGLLPYLEQYQINTLIVSGSETDVCVLASVLAAIDRGYRVIVVRDGVCSSSDATHDALIALYTKRFDVQLELMSRQRFWHPCRYRGREGVAAFGCGRAAPFSVNHGLERPVACSPAYVALARGAALFWFCLARTLVSSAPNRTICAE